MNIYILTLCLKDDEMAACYNKMHCKTSKLKKC